jgi:hypothetical protein
MATSAPADAESNRSTLSSTTGRATDRTDDRTSVPASAPAPRSALRSVAVPTEHGGWGLTFEPVLLGLLVAPTLAGVCLGLVALLAFLARTPTKIALVDVRRGRHLPRTRVARRVAAIELSAALALLLAAILLAGSPFWAPAVLIAPLVGLELWFDMRSRSRRLVPELAGAVGVTGVAAMILLADGVDWRVAAGAWLVLAGRAVTAIPFVRGQVARLHHRPTSPSLLIVTDGVALAMVALAVGLDTALIAGAVSVAMIVVYQRLSTRWPTPRAVILGLRQTILGLAVVVITAMGIIAA